MARFHVYRINRPDTIFVLDVQSNYLDKYNTRVVVPLVTSGHPLVMGPGRLHPNVTIDGHSFALVPQQLGAIPISELGALVTNLEYEHRDAIVAALDFLFEGY